jgi:hypothetical protein
MRKEYVDTSILLTLWGWVRLRIEVVNYERGSKF